MLSNAIPNNERIITIEDSADSSSSNSMWCGWKLAPRTSKARDSHSAGPGAKRPRMRPDRIIVGEVRGAEVLDMLQAMNTGHDGSLSTVHANSARDALSRLETMVMMSGVGISVTALREYIGSALDMMIHVARPSDGNRKVVRVTEVVGMEEADMTTQDIFVFEQQGIDKEGR